MVLNNCITLTSSVILQFLAGFFFLGPGCLVSAYSESTYEKSAVVIKEYNSLTLYNNNIIIDKPDESLGGK